MGTLTRKDQIDAYVQGVQQGKPDRMIQEELELSDTVFAFVKQAALDSEVERLKDVKTEQVYVEYCMAQRGCIHDLDVVLKTKNVPMTAYVGAVKARSEILDKMIKFGQDVGIIAKAPDKKQIVAGVVVTQLSNEELKAAITDQIAGLNQLVTEFGDQKFDQLDPGQLYRAKPIEAKAKVIDAQLPPPTPRFEPKVDTSDVDKRNRAKSNKVHRGRRVVKPPPR